MAKKHLHEKNPREKIDVFVESQQWESPSPPRFTWRQALLLSILLGAGILFAFGFLFIAGLVLLAIITINILFFIIRKLTQ
jgi:hypothetical protein